MCHDSIRGFYAVWDDQESCCNLGVFLGNRAIFWKFVRMQRVDRQDRYYQPQNVVWLDTSNLDIVLRRRRTPRHFSGRCVQVSHHLSFMHNRWFFFCVCWLIFLLSFWFWSVESSNVDLESNESLLACYPVSTQLRLRWSLKLDFRIEKSLS